MERGAPLERGSLWSGRKRAHDRRSRHGASVCLALPVSTTREPIVSACRERARSMKPFVCILACASALIAAGKLTFDDEVELIRGLTAESGKVKTYLPRSKKPLEYDAKGTWDKQAWLNAGEKLGPAARVGETVQITKVTLENDKIVLEINGGIKSGKHWYDHVQVGMGNT